MNRKRDELIPLEYDLLSAGLELHVRGHEEFHGFLVAKMLGEQTGSKSLTAHGTLYKAFARLADRGLVESRWEDPVLAAEEGRPRRRLYRVTAAGRRELARHARELGQATPTLLTVPLQADAGSGGTPPVCTTREVN